MAVSERERTEKEFDMHASENGSKTITAERKKLIVRCLKGIDGWDCNPKFKFWIKECMGV